MLDERLKEVFDQEPGQKIILDHNQFVELLKDEKTVIYKITEGRNFYGTFLFVTLENPTIRPNKHGIRTLNFFGLGLDETTGNWRTDRWDCYRFGNSDDPAQIENQDALKQIETRKSLILERFPLEN